MSTCDLSEIGEGIDCGVILEVSANGLGTNQEPGRLGLFS
jgi:hypothetical protein